jgi:hypothetical protein
MVSSARVLTKRDPGNGAAMLMLELLGSAGSALRTGRAVIVGEEMREKSLK